MGGHRTGRIPISEPFRGIGFFASMPAELTPLVETIDVE